MPEKELLFRLTAKDFEVQHIRGSGAGGQHRNKVHTGVRIKHPASGAVGTATDSKSQHTNKKAAFRRLVDSDKFKAWHRIEVARRTMDMNAIDRKVEKMMNPENLLIEYGDIE
jgi:peptide chain release factor 1